jgi:hypothetical protein
MKVCFVALSVPVLNLSYAPDTEGIVIPPECFVEHKDVVPVTYGGGNDTDEAVVGHARLYRKGNVVYGDFTLFSTWGKGAKALAMIRKLRPAAALTVKEMTLPVTYFRINIEGVIVTPHMNHDRLIQPFGEKVMERPAKAEMN